MSSQSFYSIYKNMLLQSKPIKKKKKIYMQRNESLDLKYKFE